MGKGSTKKLAPAKSTSAASRSARSASKATPARAIAAKPSSNSKAKPPVKVAALVKASAIKASPLKSQPVVKAAPITKAAAKAAPVVKTAPAAKPSISRPLSRAEARQAPVGMKPFGKPRVNEVEIKAVGRSFKPFNAQKNHAPAVPVPLPPAPVSTDGKPRKNQAGLNSKELEFFRELLLAKRRELVGDMSSMEREALRSAQGSNLSNLPMHMADMGTDNYEQEFTLGLVEKDRQLLREINMALAKILNGTYGICEGTGKPISKARLEAQPWAKHGIEYAREMERGGIRR